METYKATGDFTWLTAAQYMEVATEAYKEGKVLRNKFGKFQDDIEHIDKIMDYSKNDAKFFMWMMEDTEKKWKNGGPEKEELKKQMELEAQQPPWNENKEECEDFAQWLRDYMVYAGYGSPGEMP